MQFCCWDGLNPRKDKKPQDATRIAKITHLLMIIKTIKLSRCSSLQKKNKNKTSNLLGNISKIIIIIIILFSKAKLQAKNEHAVDSFILCSYFYSITASNSIQRWYSMHASVQLRCAVFSSPIKTKELFYIYAGFIIRHIHNETGWNSHSSRRWI